MWKNWLTNIENSKTMTITKTMTLKRQSWAKLQFMVWAPWALGSGLPGLWAPWAPWALGSGQDVLGSRVYWAPWAPKQESALSL